MVCCARFLLATVEQMLNPQRPLKYRLWRVLMGKTLSQAARDLRLPDVVVGLVEKGLVEPIPPRWIERFQEVYGSEAAAELLSPAGAAEVIGPASASTDAAQVRLEGTL